MESPFWIEFPLISWGKIPEINQGAACSEQNEFNSKLISVEFHKWLKKQCGQNLHIFKRTLLLFFQYIIKFIV